MPKDQTPYYASIVDSGPSLQPRSQSQHPASTMALDSDLAEIEYLKPLHHGHSHPVDWGALNAYSPNQDFPYAPGPPIDTILPPEPEEFPFHTTPAPNAEDSHSLPLSNSQMAIPADQQELISNPSLISQLLPREQQEPLRQILCNIFATSWWRHNEPEPEGTFTPFIEILDSHKYKCIFCHTVQSRMDRAVAHCRKHLHHRPFYCTGENCRSGPGSCGSRFFTRECLTAHRKHNKQTCSVCATPVEEKNMTRHRRSKRCSQSTAFRQTSSGTGLDAVWNSMAATDIYPAPRGISHNFLKYRRH